MSIFGAVDKLPKSPKKKLSFSLFFQHPADASLQVVTPHVPSLPHLPSSRIATTVRSALSTIPRTLRHDTLSNRCARALNHLQSEPEQALARVRAAVPELSWYTHEGGGAFEADDGTDAPLIEDEGLYRTVAALAALHALLENDAGLITRRESKEAPMSTKEYDAMHTSFIERSALLSIESDQKDAMFYAVAVYGIGRSVAFKEYINSFLSDDAKTDNSLQVVGHALRIASDVTLDGYKQINAALPTFTTISATQKVQLVAAFMSGFRVNQPLAGVTPGRWMPRAACGEAAVREMRALFSAAKSGMTADGLSRYLYACMFAVAGEGGTRAQPSPAVTRKLYAEYDKFIELVIRHVFPTPGERDVSTHEEPELSLYRAILSAYANSTTFNVKPEDAQAVSEEGDVSFAAARIFAASKYSLSDLKYVRSMLDTEGAESNLVKELCGKAGGREITLLHMHHMIKQCVNASVPSTSSGTSTKLQHDVETTGYSGMLEGLKKIFEVARSYVDAEAHPNADDALDVSVSGLAAALRTRNTEYEEYKKHGAEWTAPHVAAYEGGKTLADILSAHDAHVKRLNASCAELYLTLKAGAGYKGLS